MAAVKSFVFALHQWVKNTEWELISKAWGSLETDGSCWTICTYMYTASSSSNNKQATTERERERDRQQTIQQQHSLNSGFIHPISPLHIETYLSCMSYFILWNILLNLWCTWPNWLANCSSSSAESADLDQVGCHDVKSIQEMKVELWNNDAATEQNKLIQVTEI